MTRWFAIGIVSIFAILVIGCGSGGAPAPEDPSTSQDTAQPPSTSTPSDEPTATPQIAPLEATPTPPDAATGPGAQPGDTVAVHYTGRLEDGTVFDSSEGKDPLEFTLGQGELIPGFEDGVRGMEPGQSRTVDIAAEDAYGPHNPELVFEEQRSELPPELELEVGMQVQGAQPDGSVAVFTVVDLTDTTVTLDGNHPLAGEDLTFDIEVVSVN